MKEASFTENNGVTVRIDYLEVLFITAEVKAADGKFVLVGTTDYAADCKAEVPIQIWITDRSYIHDDLVLDIGSYASGYGLVEYQDFKSDGIMKQEVAEQVDASILKYLGEIEKACSYLLPAIDKNFVYDEEQCRIS